MNATTDEGGDIVEPCEECDGRGWVDDDRDGGTMTCPTCEGDGHT